MITPKEQIQARLQEIRNNISRLVAEERIYSDTLRQLQELDKPKAPMTKAAQILEVVRSYMESGMGEEIKTSAELLVMLNTDNELTGIDVLSSERLGSILSTETKDNKSEWLEKVARGQWRLKGAQQDA